MTEHGIKSLANKLMNIYQALMIIGPYTVNQLCWCVIHMLPQTLIIKASLKLPWAEKLY